MRELEGIIIPLAGIFFLFGLPVILHFKKDFMKMKMQQGQNVDSKLLEELQALKHQIAELRDTTTRYDMSFDSALQRLENRMTHMESQVNSKPADQVYAGRSE